MNRGKEFTDEDVVGDSVSAAMAFSKLLKVYMDPVVPTIDVDTDPDATIVDEKGQKKVSRAYADKVKGSRPGIYGLDTRLAVLTPLVCSLVMFVYHCTWVTSNAYSSPSVVLASRNADGSPAVIDDFRSAYKWLRENTKEDAVIASWWDYGYQIAGFSNRTTLVDNSGSRSRATSGGFKADYRPLSSNRHLEQQ